MLCLRNYSALVIIFLCCTNPALPNDQRFPSCTQISLDEDGDGYGYENGQSCIVDSNTSLTAIAGECIDDNADGWGWNGVSSCQVPVPVNNECEDTAPLGDGWGWNGTTSCRVVPGEPQSFSELDDLKSRLVTISGRNQKLVGMYCPDTDETFYLTIYGRAEYFVGSQKMGTGLWTTGLYEQDGLMNMLINNRFYAFGTNKNTRELIISSRRCVFFEE